MNGLHPELQASFSQRLENAVTFEYMTTHRLFTHYSERNWLFDHCTIEDITIDHLRVIKLAPLHSQVNSPCIIWMHGGGMVVGQPDDSLPFLIDFVETVGATILVPQYRLAPEHPYPAALEDGFATMQWANNNLQYAKLIMAGASAGGNLALAISLYARDHNGPTIDGIIPIYPMLDAKYRTAHTHFTSPAIWNIDKNTKAWAAYLQNETTIPSYASPLYADLSNLPPMYTYIGTHDMFYEEVLEFIQLVKQANGTISYHLYEGCYHAFDLEPLPIAHIAKLRLLAATARMLA